MGDFREEGASDMIDAWLREGGRVVTSSERAARAISASFHRARLAEGLTAWPAPDVLDWKSFARAAWHERAFDGRLVLNQTQESSLWAAIAKAGGSGAALLEGPLHRLAGLAMEAHELLCSYAPKFLQSSARTSWQQDAAALSGWLAAFDQTCRDGSLLSPSRLPLELIQLLKADSTDRPPLLLTGFDRLLPLQRDLFDAWGVWREAPHGSPASDVHFHQAADMRAELAACALWCKQQLAANPNARLLVLTQDANKRRGEIERAFLQFAAGRDSGSSPTFEFSLGVPLRQVAVARAAHLILRWLSEPLAEEEVDWLFSTGLAARSAEESAALESYMRALRRFGLERTRWTVEALSQQQYGSRQMPASWLERMIRTSARLEQLRGQRRLPLEWADLVPELLEALGFAQARTLSSVEFQALRRWRQAVDECASVGFDGRRISWQDFLSLLNQTLDETLFAPESSNAPILISGPAESAGLTADAVWFLGANEDAWPAKSATHPLLPLEVQRAAGMPHATPQLDWELARSITNRLLTTAANIHFSYARQGEDGESRPSRLALAVAKQPQPLPEELLVPAPLPPLTVAFEDLSRVPFPGGEASGGSSVLTSQSQCPFKAFATARLAASGWSPAEFGLTASQRGQLLHAVLHSIWAGPPDGIRTLAQLLDLTDRSSFVESHVRRVVRQEIPVAARELMPRRYLQLEERRLVRLVTEWLNYEATRASFEVAATEVKRTIKLSGLTLNVRLDRIDQLNDGSLLVIDYKSGNVFVKSWELPRPEDVQLPLYAGFALSEDERLGGLVFAKVRPGENELAGRVFAPAATLFSGLKGNTSLVRNSLNIEEFLEWREAIEQLARDFVNGKADVDPRDYPKTCERCDLQALCRIQEQQPQLDSQDDAEVDGTDDE